MSQPVIALKSSGAVEVEAGQSYWRRSCGKGADQPFCGCKQSAAGALCDGSHQNL